MNAHLKNIEIAFRRFLVATLSKFVRRRRPAPQGLDFSTCKFLFVRQDRIGDVLVSTPLFECLRRRYPGATIDVLLSENNHFALSENPFVRRRWVYNKRVADSVRLLLAIRRERYDFVIDLMDNPSATSTVICLLSGARWSVGLEKENAYAYDIVVPLPSRRDTHIVDRIAQLLGPFGIDPGKERFRIRYDVSDRSREFASEVFRRAQLKRGATVGINISAGHDVRFWGVENFRSLISLLQRTRSFPPILLLYKPSHETLARQIVQGYQRVTLSPKTGSFDEFAALIGSLGLLITPDTSAVHLAAAFHIPSVVMYVQSNKDLRIWEPYGSPNVSLVADVDNLRLIAPQEVARAAVRLLGNRKRSVRSAMASVREKR